MLTVVFIVVVHSCVLAVTVVVKTLGLIIGVILQGFVILIINYVNLGVREAP